MSFADVMCPGSSRENGISESSSPATAVRVEAVQNFERWPGHSEYQVIELLCFFKLPNFLRVV